MVYRERTVAHKGNALCIFKYFFLPLWNRFIFKKQKYFVYNTYENEQINNCDFLGTTGRQIIKEGIKEHKKNQYCHLSVWFVLFHHRLYGKQTTEVSSGVTRSTLPAVFCQRLHSWGLTPFPPVVVNECNCTFSSGRLCTNVYYK